jgi:UDP-glucose 4-epimerase
MAERKTIIVTGGTGYIGSHTVVELQQAGFHVLIIDNLCNSRREVVDAIQGITGYRPEFTELDLLDAERLKNVFQDAKAEAVIHFAALKAVGESVEHPFSYYRNNLGGLMNLLEACRHSGTQRIVFSSSCSVYGEPAELPVRETTPLKKAESPYANTKRIGEDILRDCSVPEKLHVISLRYFNPVGAHPTCAIGEYPVGAPLNLFPVITQTAIGLRSKLSVFGTDYPTPDGSCIRDYIHVVDVARAHVAAVKRLISASSESSHEVFNIGTGTGRSVLEVINTFERITGIQLSVEKTNRRPGDVIQAYADTRLANETLSWKAEIGLDEMLRSAWEWQQSLSKKKNTDRASILIK